MIRWPVLVDSSLVRAAGGGVSGATAAVLTSTVDASLPVRIVLVGSTTLALYVLLAAAYRFLTRYRSGSM